jgi:hypothetical protein
MGAGGCWDRSELQTVEETKAAAPALCADVVQCSSADTPARLHQHGHYDSRARTPTMAKCSSSDKRRQLPAGAEVQAPDAIVRHAVDKLLIVTVRRLSPTPPTPLVPKSVTHME